MSRYHGPGDYKGGTTPRQKVKAQKRFEARQRNKLTVEKKRKAWRWANG